MNNRTTIMIALIAVVMMIVPASADVTNFTVTPDTTVAGATAVYTVQLNTTGLTSLNITIPAGYDAVAPAAGESVARVDLWGIDPDDGTTVTANVTFTANNANPSTEVNVSLNVSGDDDSPFELTQDVSYSALSSTVIKSPKGGKEEMMNLTLPNATVNGSLKLYALPDSIKNMTVTLYLVKNPAESGTYTFVADGTNSSAVTIGLPKNGDINGDGKAEPTLKDITYIAKHVAGLSGYETIYADGDINGDGKAEPTLKDITYLAKHVAGLSGYETIYP